MSRRSTENRRERQWSWPSSLDGQAFTALNGGPLFKFNEAISFQVNCDNQEEVDYYWEKLSAGGDKKAQQCGWLKDKASGNQVLTSMHMDR